MTFSFNIIPFYEGKRANFYTIIIDGEDLPEGDKFLSNERVNKSSHFKKLKQVFFNLLNRFGARQQFFKDEGLAGDMVKAFYVRRGNLRWYCLRWSEQMVIFGSGGVKNVRATQDDPYLKNCEYALRWIDKCLTIALKEGKISVSGEGKLSGDLRFNKEDYINL